MSKESKRAAGKLSEGAIRKGGTKPKPTSPKPNVKPVGQTPSPNKNEQSVQATRPEFFLQVVEKVLGL